MPDKIPDLTGKRILVTGGTGFIGGRLVERLVLQQHAKVRVLMRTWSRGARIARFPCEMVMADVTSQDQVDRAVAGCDIVFHCAYGTEGSSQLQRRVNVEGTLNILRAASLAGVGRVVHVSTISVYGETVDGDVDEQSPRRYSRNVYADTKLDAENAVLNYASKSGLDVSVVQPTMVYGPYSPSWTVRILNELKSARIILVNGGTGLCHPVYVDDVVTAMLLAAVNEDARGEVFLVAGDRPVTWAEFYGRFEEMLGYESTFKMSLKESLAFSKQNRKRTFLVKEALSIFRSDKSVRNRIVETAEAAAVIGLLHRFVPEPLWQRVTERIVQNAPGAQLYPETSQRPIQALPAKALKWHATKPRFQIDKARRILGYEPQFDFQSGMQLTEAWARWANLLGG